MRYLSLDIGTRRTGVAYLDTDVGIPLPLETIHHTSVTQLLASVKTIIAARGVTEVVVGMPLLPSGDEGSQATFVKSVAEKIEESGLAVRFVDERYTTPRAGNREGGGDGDATAACQILASMPLE